MHVSSSTFRRGLAVVAVTSLVAAVAACSSSGGSGSAATASAPGITATTVTVGTHQPLTGPAAPGYSKISAATKAYFDYVNSKGGVNGRKIVYNIMDDGYDPTKTQTDVRQLVLNDHVFAILDGLGTPTHTGVLDFLKSNKVPDLFVASGSESWNQPAKYPDTFGWQPDYKVEGKILGSWAAANLAGKKMCFFGQGDDFGADMLAGVEQEVGGASGIASNQSYDPTNTNVGPQIGALAAAKCQVVFAATIPGFTALALGTSAALKFQAQWIVSNVGSDYATVAGLLGKGAPLLEGVISDDYLPVPSDTTDPWIQLFQQVNTQFNNNAAWDGNVEYGMAVGYTFVQSLLAAGKNPTRASILTAVEKNGFTGPGLTPFRFSKSDHSGYTGTRMAKVSGGVVAFFGPTYTTDDSSGAVTEYNGTESTPPANGIPTS